MIAMRKTLIWMVLMIMPLTLWSQEGGRKVDKVIAVVGDEPVLLSEFQSIYSLMVTQMDLNQLQDSAQRAEFERKLKHDVLNQIIRYKLFYVAAKKDTTIQITDEQVESALEEWVKDVEAQLGPDSFQSLLNKLHLDREGFKNAYRWFIKVQLYADRYIQSHVASQVQISPTELDSLYEIYKDSLIISPENVRVAHILIRVKPSKKEVKRAKKTADRIYRKLMEGEDFATMAQRYSDDLSSASMGGYIGLVPRSFLKPDVAEEIFSLEPGQISEPVRLPDGFHIFKCVSKDTDRIELSHILIKFNLTKEDSEKALKQAQKVLAEIQKGASFDSLAQLYSEDESTKDFGGDIGWVQTELLPQPIRDSLATMKIGDIKGPILTDYGYHIVKLVDRTEKQVATKEQFAQLLRNQKLLEAVDEEEQKLRNEFKVEIKVDLSQL